MTAKTTPDEALGMAGRLARTFIRSPLSPLILLAMLGLGIAWLVLAPRQEDPEISVPPPRRFRGWRLSPWSG